MARDRDIGPPQGHSEALVGRDTRLTYARLADVADSLRPVLAGRGAFAGSVVAFRAEQTVASVIALHAIWRAGLVAAPFHPELPASERTEALAAVNPAVVLDDLEDAVGEILNRNHDTAAKSASSPDQNGSPTGLPEREAHEIAAIVWTSGSTGPAKGVKLTWEGFRTVAAGSAFRMGLRSSDRWLLSLTPATMGGLALVVRAALLGSCVRVQGTFDARAFVGEMEAGAFTHASLVPTQLGRVLAERAGRPPPATLRGILLGGAAASPKLLQDALSLGYPLYPTYGMTETTSQVATADPETARAHPGTVGRPLDGVELQLGTGGQIMVRGATVSPGTLAGPLRTVNGWFATGDLGRLDGEGRLWVVGRLRDRIVSGGVTVDPVHVERITELHVQVEQACVVGVPDAEWGERLTMVLVAGSNQPLDTGSLVGHLREHLQPALRPKEIFRAAALPVARSGKLDRSAVRKMLVDAREGLTRLYGG